MSNRQAVRYRDRLDSRFEMFGRLPDDLELQAQWARYLCILVSGFIEVSVRGILREYAKSTASPNVANYVAQRLERFQNPKMGKILDLVGGFSLSWRTAIETSITDEQKDSVNSVVNIKNILAHGEDSGITYAAIKRHYANVTKVIKPIEATCI